MATKITKFKMFSIKIYDKVSNTWVIDPNIGKKINEFISAYPPDYVIYAVGTTEYIAIFYME